jgi:amidase
MWALQADRTAYAARIYAKWNATAARTRSGRPIDGLLTPAMALPPCRHDRFRHVGYTCIWNMADFASVVLPVTEVDKARDHVEKGYQPRNDDDKAVYEECASAPSSLVGVVARDRFTDDAEAYHGAPIALQLVARRLEEEKAIAMAKVVHSVL